MPNEEKDCTRCSQDTPFSNPVWYAEGHVEPCVAECPVGHGADNTGACTACEGETPYVGDNMCVSKCPPGQVPAGGDSAEAANCTPCAEGEFADHAGGVCVREDSCPEDTLPNNVTMDCEDPCKGRPFRHGDECVEVCPGGTAPDETKQCNDCDTTKPYSDGVSCVAQCAAGSVPGEDNACEACPAEDETPYALQTNATCVATCPAGMAPNAGKDCVTCEADLPYADHTAHACVAACPPGQAPDQNNDCTMAPPSDDGDNDDDNNSVTAM